MTRCVDETVLAAMSEEVDPEALHFEIGLVLERAAALRTHARSLFDDGLQRCDEPVDLRATTTPQQLLLADALERVGCQVDRLRPS